MAVVSETKTFYPVSIEVLNATGGSITVQNPSRCTGDSGSTESGNYAQYNIVTGNNAETIGWLLFDFSEIPNDATITELTGKFKIYHTGNSNQISTRQVRLYYGNRQTVKGYSVNIPQASTAVTSLSAGTAWTREMLDDTQLRVYTKRGTRNSGSTYSVRVYGVDITVTYEYDDGSSTGSGVSTKENGVWNEASAVYKKINGDWVPQTDAQNIFTDSVYLKTDGTLFIRKN